MTMLSTPRPAAAAPTPRLTIPALTGVVSDCRDLLEHSAATSLFDSSVVADLARWVDSDRVAVDVLINGTLDDECLEALAGWLRLTPEEFWRVHAAAERVSINVDDFATEIYIG